METTIQCPSCDQGPQVGQGWTVQQVDCPLCSKPFITPAFAPVPRVQEQTAAATRPRLWNPLNPVFRTLLYYIDWRSFGDERGIRNVLGWLTLLTAFAVSSHGGESNRSTMAILVEQAPNASAWVLSPLEEAVPGTIRQNLLSLQEDILDEGKTTPRAPLVVYSAAFQLCNGMIVALDERNAALVAAGFTIALADEKSTVKSQALDARRNYLMSWPQYSRESDQRRSLERDAANKAAVLKERPKLDWAARVSKLRLNLDKLYTAFRAELRRDPAVLAAIVSAKDDAPKRDLIPDQTISTISSAPVTSSSTTVEIHANNDGVRIGPVKAGQTISLQYVSGKWKAFGRLATSNPDDRTPGISGDDHDRSRLAIAKARIDAEPGEVIAVVPGGTATEPFLYRFATDCENVVLRINTGSDQPGNPGSVVYSYTLKSM